MQNIWPVCEGGGGVGGAQGYYSFTHEIDMFIQKQAFS